MKKALILVCLVLIGLLLCIRDTPQIVLAEFGQDFSGANEVPIHYLVFEFQGDGIIQPVVYQRLYMPYALQSLSAVQVKQALNQPQRNYSQMIVLLQAADGSTIFQDVIRYSTTLRGEFASADPAKSIDRQLVTPDNSSFVIRLPDVSAHRLILLDSQMTPLAEFDLDSLVNSTPSAPDEITTFIENTRILSGSPVNRVDLVVIGDGYTAAQAGTFLSNANSVLDTFFSISPLSEYRNYYNIYIVAAESAQSGADHPPYSVSCNYYSPTCCGDIEMLTDPLQGQMVATAFDSRYCAYYVHRLLVPNYSKVYAAAGAAVPEWDQLLLIVNDTTYGGSGATSLAVASMHSLAVGIAQHEYGHSFANLADEYDSAYPGYPTCSDLPGSISPCESNVTDVTVRENIKWQPWILDDTLIPTPNNPIYDGLVGLFEGARYQTTGMYRSGYSCIMRALGEPFCQVPSQSYVLKLYQGGWGIPSAGISLIEPDSTFPVSTIITLTHPATQVFTADILSPIGGPQVEISWMYNGIPINNAMSDTLTLTTSADSPGLHEITLLVEDVTSLVNPLMSDGDLLYDYLWQVNVVITQPITVAISAHPLEIFADGVSISTISATVTDPDGPLEGVLVEFSTTLGTLDPVKATTDATGTAVVSLRSNSAGTAVVTANVGSASSSIEVTFLALPETFLPLVMKE